MAYLNGPGIDNKLRQTSNAGTLYFVNDHLGSTRVLTDSNGDVIENINYDSFGNGGSNLTRYGYTGREWDADAGLYYYRARWYDPRVGRFISEDPIGLEGGINLYAYVENNPLSFRDPTGLQRDPRVGPDGKAKGDLSQFCDTDDCIELAKDIGILELSLHMRDFIERNEFGGVLDVGHEQRIRDEDQKLAECKAKYLAKCRDCDKRFYPRPMRKKNIETQSERNSKADATHYRNRAIWGGLGVAALAASAFFAPGLLGGLALAY